MIDERQSKESNIVGFVCNWGAYAALDMAGVNGRRLPANVKLVKLSCLGRISLGLVLKAMELGAGGVLVVACPVEECHFESGALRAKEMVGQARKVLDLLGIDPRRLGLVEAPTGRDDLAVKQIDAFADSIGHILSGSETPVSEAITCQESVK